MNKKYTQFCTLLVLIPLLIVTIIITSCKLGLGETVDVLPPEIRLDYPPTNSVIMDSFIVKGTSSDDVGITSVTITFETTEYTEKKTYGPYSAVVNGDSYTFEANEKDNNDNFLIPDGKYEMIVVGTDATGRDAKIQRTITIDNTAPILVLSQPSTVHTDTSFQQYGTIINIVGAIGESNTVNNLVVKGYSPTNTSTPDGIYESNEIFPQNLDHRIEMDSDFYKKLYPNPDKPSGDKNYYFTVAIKDNAKLYKTPGDNGFIEGNESVGYYINNTDYATIAGTKTTLELYNMYNGTYFINPDGTIDEAKKTEAATTKKALETIKINQSTEGSEKMGSFTLNPENSPVWELLSVDPFSGTITENDFVSFSNSGVISIKANRGRDKSPLKPETISVKITEAEFDNTGKFSGKTPISYVAFPASVDDEGNPVLTGDDVITRNKKIKVSGDGYEVSISLDGLLYIADNGELKTKTLDAGQYFVEVFGEDANGKSFLDDKIYGFGIIGIEAAPIITINNPVNSEGFVALDKSITLNISLDPQSSTNEEITVGLVCNELGIDFTDGLGFDTTGNVLKDYQYDIDFTGKAEKAYTIIVKAKEGEGAWAEKAIKVYYDTSVPVIDITGVSPIVTSNSIDSVNGIVTVNGNISDGFDKLKTGSLQFTINGGQDSVVANTGANYVSTVNDVSTFTISDRFNGLQIDTTKIASSNLDIKFFAEDRAGNKSQKDYSIAIDQSLDKPVVNVSNGDKTIADDANIKVGKNLFGKTSNNTLLGTISDDDGVESLEIVFTKDGTSTTKVISVTSGTTSASWQCDLSDFNGIYSVKITAIDTERKDSTDTNNILEMPDFKIAVTDDKPIISVVSPAQNAWSSGDVTVQLAWASDNATLNPVTITATGDGTVVSDLDTTTKKEIINVGSAGGSFDRTYTLTDRFGQKANDIFDYKVDKGLPVISVDAGLTVSEYINSASPEVSLEGVASDPIAIGETEASGLYEVKYIVVANKADVPTDWNKWTFVLGTSADWLVKADVSTYFNGTDFVDSIQGEYDIYVKAKDIAGNYSTSIKKTVTYDTQDPAIDIVTSYKSGSTPGWNPETYTVTYNDSLALASYEILLQSTGVKLASGTLSQSVADTPVEKSFTVGTNSGELNISGQGNLIFKVTDKSGKTVQTIEEFKNDTELPEIEIRNISPIVVDSSTGTDVDTVNGIIAVRGTITDNLAFSTNGLTVSINGPESAITSGATFVSTASGVSTFTIPASFNSDSTQIKIDTTQIESENLVLTFTAKDEAGNIETVTEIRKIDQDLDKPQIALSNASMTITENSVERSFAESDVKFGSNFFGKTANSVLQGTITDDDGIESLEIAVYQGDAPVTADWKTIDVTKGTTSSAWKYDLKDYEEDLYKVQIRAKDTVHTVSSSDNNKYDSITFAIGIIESKPTITITGPSQNTYYNGTIDVGFSWTDVFATASTMPILTATDHEDSSGVSSAITSSLANKTFTDELMVGTEDNERVYTITDRFGQTASTKFTYKVDAEAPTIASTSSPHGKVVNLPSSPIVRIEGTASDTGSSGLNEVKYIVTETGNDNSPLTNSKPTDWSTWVAVDGLDSWIANVDLTGKADNTEYDIYIMSKDIAGNYSDELTYTVKADSELPSIGVTPNYANTGDIWNPTSFDVDFGDSVGLVKYSITTQSGTELLSDDVTGTSADIIVIVGTGSGELDLPEGKGNLVFTVTDESGKTTSETVAYKNDATASEIEFTNVNTVDADEKPTTSFISKNDNFYASFTDEVSGAKEISYEFMKDGETDNARKDTITVTEGTTSLNIKIPVTKNGSTLSDGIYTLTIRATDVAGNTVSSFARARIDTNRPTIVITAPMVNGIVKKGDSLTITGTASDANDLTLDKVELSIINPSYDGDELSRFKKTILSSDITAKNWNWELAQDQTPFLYNGEYTITAIAYDLSGNTHEAVVVVACDATAPTFTFNRPYPSTGAVEDYVYATSQTDATIGAVRLETIANDFSMKEIWYQVGKDFTVTKDSTGAIKEIAAPSTVGFAGGSTNNPHFALRGDWVKSSEIGTLTVDIDTTSLTDYAIKENESDEEGILYIHVVGIDQANNIGYAKYPVKINTNLDKPIVTILSPDASSGSASVGGAFVVSGSAIDNTGIDSVYMKIVVTGGNYTNDTLVGTENFALTFGEAYPAGYSKKYITQANVDDGSFMTTTDRNDNGMFSNKNNWYQIDGTSGWSHLINKNGDFNTTSDKLGQFLQNYDSSTPGTAEITVSVMAIDDKATDKASSTIQTMKIVIDGGSPSILETTAGSIPEVNSSVSGYFPFSVTIQDDDEVSSVEIKANDVTVKDLFKVTTDGTSAKVYEGAGTGGKVDSVALSKAAGSNVINLEIIAFDNAGKSSTFTRKFVVDNTAPTDRNGGNIQTSMLDGTSPREPASRGSHLRVKTAQALFEGRVADEANGSGVNRIFFYFTKGTDDAQKVYSVRNTADTTQTGVTMSNTLSVYDSTGTKVDVKVPFDYETLDPTNAEGAYIVVDSSEGYMDTGVNGDNDGFEENLRIDGYWGVNFDSTRLKDGVYDINYIIEDNAGNMRHYVDTMLVQNNAPVITSLILSTGIITDPAAEGFVGLELTPDQFTNNRFQVRGYDFDVKVVATGDNTPLKYTLTGANQASTSGVEFAATSENPSKFSINGEANFPTQDISGAKQYTTYTISVEDSLKDGDTNLFLQSGDIDFKVQLANADNVKPQTQLFDLNTRIEYNEPSDDLANDAGGSLYMNGDGVVQGHTEPRVLKSGGAIESEQQASGKVILRGTVTDNQTIKELKISIDEGEPKTIATATDAGFTLEPGATIKMMPRQDVFDDITYEWSYIWDTETLADIAKKGVVVKVSATDKGNLSSDDKAWSDANKDYYNIGNVDVVPYITSLSRDTSKYKTVRSRLGYYALLRGENLYVEGFNVKDGTVNVKKESNADTSGYDYNFSLVGTQATVPNTAKSGWVSVTVNDVESTNNTTKGTADKQWNKENITQLPETKLWTNDRYMYIWSSGDDANHKFDVSSTPTYPSMTKNDKGLLYASYATVNNPTVYYAPMGGNKVSTGSTSQPSLYTDITMVGTDDVYISYLANFNGNWGNDWNTNNEYMHGGVLTYVPGLEVKNSSPGVTDLLAAYGERLFHRQQYLQYTHMKTASVELENGNNMVHTVYYDAVTKSIKYSGLNVDKDLNDTDLVNEKQRETAWINIDGGKEDGHDDGTSYNLSGDFAIESTYLRNDDAYTNYVGVDSKGVDLTRSGATTPYAAIAVDEERHPVIVYITTDGALRIAHASIEESRPITNVLTTHLDADGTMKEWVAKKDPQFVTEDEILPKWKVQEVATNALDHVSIKVDSTGKVHVAYRDVMGRLCYLSAEDSDDGTDYSCSSPTIIDDEGAQWVDMSLNGDIPYISYMPKTDSYDAMRMTYLVEGTVDGVVTSDTWEYMTVPLTYKPQNDRTHIETDVKFGNSDNKMKVAIGFSDGDAFRVTYLVE